jgi:hypothetical protein
MTEAGRERRASTASTGSTSTPYDAASLRYFDTPLAEARHGEAGTVEQYLAASCS